MEGEAQSIAAVVAAELKRNSKHIHITFAEPLEGRIAFGGTLE